MARTFASRLRQTREAAKISGSELSKLAGVSRGLVSSIETGTTTRPQITTLMAIANVFGVSCEYLLNGEGAAPTKAELRERLIAARKAARSVSA